MEAVAAHALRAEVASTKQKPLKGAFFVGIEKYLKKSPRCLKRYKIKIISKNAMPLCLTNGSDAYLLNHGVLCIKNRQGEFNFNDLSADFISEIIKKQPTEIEDLQTTNLFPYKVQAHILKDWLLEKDIIARKEDIAGSDCTINEYKNKSTTDIFTKEIKYTNKVFNKTISIEPYYKRDLREEELYMFTEKLGEELSKEMSTNYPFTNDRKPKKIRLILTETRIDNKILSTELGAEDEEICVPVISSEEDFEIGPIYDKTINTFIDIINERTMIKAGPSHEIRHGVPFIAGNRFPITGASAKSLAIAVAFILDREFDERLKEEDYNKVWKLPYDKCVTKTSNITKSLSKTQIHIINSTIDSQIELSKEYRKSFEVVKRSEVINPENSTLEIPIFDRLKKIRLQRLSTETDGGHRLLNTAQTRRLITPFVDNSTGIMDEIDLTAIDNDIFMYSAARVVGAATVNTKNNSETARSTGFPISAAGKGRTTTQSQVSCIAEAIERYSANFPVFKPIVIESTAEQLGDSAINPNVILNFSPKQYHSREEINSNTDALIHKVPKQFKNDIPTHWSPIINIIHPEDSRFIPTAMLGFNYTNNLQPGTAVSCSNGLASGNSKAEAMVQALYEIIERDACAIWWYNKLNINRCTIPENIQSYASKIKHKLNSMGRSFEILELPTDFDITVTCCISHTYEGRLICVGLGSHYDASVSVSRAITEMYQMLVGIKRYESMKSNIGMGNGGIDKLVGQWLRTETIENHPHLRGKNESTSCRNFKKKKFEYIEEELEYILNQFNNKGMAVYGVNMTAKTIGFPVVKMLVPGMRHFWPRLGEGRLYEVPVTLGYLNTPKKEEELNKMGFFF